MIRSSEGRILLAGGLLAAMLAGCAAPAPAPDGATSATTRNGATSTSALNGLYKGSAVFMMNGAYDNCSSNDTSASLTVVDGTGRLEVAGKTIARATVTPQGAVTLIGPPAAGGGSIAGDAFDGKATNGSCGYSLSLRKEAGSQAKVGDVPLTQPKGQMPMSHL